MPGTQTRVASAPGAGSVPGAAPERGPLYVYGITAASAPPPQTMGIGGAPLTTVREGELAALVSELATEEVELGRTELELHSEVVAATFAQHTVLPMRFGVVLSGAEAVRQELLARHAHALLAQLEAMEGMVEVRLRAVYPEAALMREVLEGSPEIATLRASLDGLDEHATYFERIRLGQMIAETVQQIQNRDAGELLDQLAPLAEEVSVGEPTHERMALTASFLVDRDALERFDQAVDDLGREHAGRLSFKYVGPLAPHSFVQLHEEG